MTVREIRSLWHQYRACVRWFADSATLVACAGRLFDAALAAFGDPEDITCAARDHGRLALKLEDASHQLYAMALFSEHNNRALGR